MLLLSGSEKGAQGRAIERAIEYLNDWKRRGQRRAHLPKTLRWWLHGGYIGTNRHRGPP